MRPTYLDDDIAPDVTRDEEIAADVSLHEIVTAADAARAAVLARREAERADYANAATRAHEQLRASFLQVVEEARDIVGDRTFDANDHLYTFLALEKRKTLGRALYMSERQELQRIAFVLWPKVRRAA